MTFVTFIIMSKYLQMNYGAKVTPRRSGAMVFFVVEGLIIDYNTEGGFNHPLSFYQITN